MLFANDFDGVRIKPTPGQKAICPLCHGQVLAKCGEIYIWHWQHRHESNCDPWKEHETKWHRAWKAKFPEGWQEFIIENEGKKHIADIKTYSGTVIEFQNSPISTSTIKIREAFYRNMIWVVNAEKFIDNLIISSVVSSALRKIEKDTDFELRSLREAYSEDLAELDEVIMESEKRLSEKNQRIERNNDLINNLRRILNDSNMFTQSVIEKWSQNASFTKYDTYGVYNWVQSELKVRVGVVQEKINNLTSNLKANEDSLAYIKNLIDYNLDGKQFKIVEYEQIPSKSFQKARAVLKASKKTFFHEVEIFQSEADFKRYKNKRDLFDFIVDPIDAIDSYNSKIKNDKLELVSRENEISKLKGLIAKELINGLNAKIKEVEDEATLLGEELNRLASNNAQLKERRISMIDNRNQYITEEDDEIKKRMKERRIKAMKNNKGLYDYEWKHERMSWRAASSTVYFDIGESYLFRRIRNGKFKKINIEEFINQYLSTSSK